MTDTPTPCRNCSSPLTGEFCADCGQRNQPLRQPLSHFLRESFVEFFSIDGRFWTSIGALVAKPGRLTTAYLSGHRVRYLRPLRLYLISSLLFFFLLTLIDPVNRLERLSAGEAAPDSVALLADYRAEVTSRLASNRERLDLQESVVDSATGEVAPDGSDIITLEGLDPALTDSLVALAEDQDDFADALVDLEGDIERDQWILRQLDEAGTDSTISVFSYERAAVLIGRANRPSNINVSVNLPEWWPETETLGEIQTARTAGDLIDVGTVILRNALNQLPTVMFLLLPVFALLLKLIYVRRGWFYSEHLVFGLHTHAFAFLIFTLILLFVWQGGNAPWVGWVTLGGLVAIPLYFLVAQKRVYGQGWLRTLGKALLLGWAYSFFLATGALIALLLAL